MIEVTEMSKPRPGEINGIALLHGERREQIAA